MTAHTAVDASGVTLELSDGERPAALTTGALGLDGVMHRWHDS